MLIQLLADRFEAFSLLHLVGLRMERKKEKKDRRKQRKPRVRSSRVFKPMQSGIMRRTSASVPEEGKKMTHLVCGHASHLHSST